MQKPDSNGFVNIIWPSKSVPHGGLFHTKVVEPSVTQQNFLKVLLDESKLSILQRSNYGFGLRQEDRKVEKKCSEATVVRPRTSRRRSLSVIRESGVFESDQYHPIKRGEDREKLKESLAHKMAYGDKDEQCVQPPPLLPKKEVKLPTKKEQWNDLLTQIRERTEWLVEMEDLGQAGPHREIVKDQVAERLRALDALGIDSQCSSARSATSGFRVVPSERGVRSSRNVKPEESALAKSKGMHGKGRKSEKKIGNREENVFAYEKLSPLLYSPRRRV